MPAAIAAAALMSALGRQCRTRGQGLTGLSPFCKNFYFYLNSYVKSRLDNWDISVSRDTTGLLGLVRS